MIERYLREVRWTPDGMAYPRLNCWGLVRLARHEIYGLPLLPAFGIDAKDKLAQTRAARGVIRDHLREVREPRPGDVVAVWAGRICTHVAVVVEIDDRLAVLEVDERIGCGWRWLRDFERIQPRVTYYRD